MSTGSICVEHLPKDIQRTGSPDKLERLKAFRAMRIESENIAEQLALLRTRAEEYTTASRRFENGKDGVTSDRIFKRFSQLEQRLAARLDDIASELEACEHILSSLPDPSRSILRLYYLFGFSWKETALRSHYCERQCRRIAKDAKGYLKDIVAQKLCYKIKPYKAERPPSRGE